MCLSLRSWMKANKQINNVIFICYVFYYSCIYILAHGDVLI